ncbi:MAG TPA: hypothetical protein VGN86_18320, partial [Pyrinomonadaceae bacterium]|nr:hypothetical protein [Pyrinomonadaceae bacterium]
RQFQVTQENVGHHLVIVLPGMNKKRRKLLFTPLHSFYQRGGLHEIWPRSDNDDYLQHVSII